MRQGENSGEPRADAGAAWWRTAGYITFRISPLTVHSALSCSEEEARSTRHLRCAFGALRVDSIGITRGGRRAQPAPCLGDGAAPLNRRLRRRIVGRAPSWCSVGGLGVEGASNLAVPALASASRRHRPYALRARDEIRGRLADRPCRRASRAGAQAGPGSVHGRMDRFRPRARHAQRCASSVAAHPLAAAGAIAMAAVSSARLR